MVHSSSINDCNEDDEISFPLDAETILFNATSKSIAFDRWKLKVTLPIMKLPWNA